MPNRDATLYIINKYINYITGIIKNLFITDIENFNEIMSFKGKTFPGIKNYKSRTPIFANSFTNNYIKRYNKINPNIPINKIKKLYYYIDSLISMDVDNYFLTPSDSKPLLFDNDEKFKIGQIILKKLNKSDYQFTNFTFLKEPAYYLNFSGKEVEPFIFSIYCNQKIGLLQIYITIAIRNDIKRNTEYLVINDIKLVINDEKFLDEIYTNNKYTEELNLKSDLAFYNEIDIKKDNKASVISDDSNYDNYFSFSNNKNSKLSDNIISKSLQNNTFANKVTNRIPNSINHSTKEYIMANLNNSKEKTDTEPFNYSYNLIEDIEKAQNNSINAYNNNSTNNYPSNIQETFISDFDDKNNIIYESFENIIGENNDKKIINNDVQINNYNVLDNTQFDMDDFTNNFNDNNYTYSDFE